jgi:acyl-CoA dehydrogenase
VSGPPAEYDMFDLAPSPAARPVIHAVRNFIDEQVEPRYAEYAERGQSRPSPRSFGAGQLEILADLKRQARAEGLWNLFLPDLEDGPRLSHLDYAHVAAELGRSPLASECMNCSPPDSGNMEVLHQFGTPEQQRRWLVPLLDGQTRSAFAMTEPGVASSDARNIAATAVLDNGEWVLNGEKYFVTGAGDPRCAFLIVSVLTDPGAAAGARHSLVLVPRGTPGLELVEPMTVFGHDDAPGGHLHLRMTDLRVPEANILLGRGRGFEIAQRRLGSGRIHACMRSIGVAERALALMVARGRERHAFGHQIGSLGKNPELISRARIDIDAMRLMVLRAARAVDLLGHRDARVLVSAAKAMIPERVCQIIDQAIQLHGATGLSQWTPLAEMYRGQRAFRLGDGPDEVHHMLVARAELSRLRTAEGSDSAEAEQARSAFRDRRDRR